MADVAEMATHLAKAYVPVEEHSARSSMASGGRSQAATTSTPAVSATHTSVPPLAAPPQEVGPGWESRVVLDENLLDPLARAMLRHMENK